jgi:hypothetical protein
MRKVALGLLAFSIVLVAVARSDEAKHACSDAKACCKAGTKSCQSHGKCSQDASCEAAKPGHTARQCCADDAACQTDCPCRGAADSCAARAVACAAGAAACATDSVCEEEVEADCSGCCLTSKIAHLEKASEHLHAAGLEAEADHVLALAHTLKHDLIVEKIAQIRRLQAELHILTGATDAPATPSAHARPAKLTK